MGGALEVFFMNTLNRNGKGQRPDIDFPIPAFGTGKFEEPVLVGDCDSYYGGLKFVQSYRNYAMPLVAQPIPPSPQFDVDMLAPQFDADMLAPQQNWYMYYHRGADYYVPSQTFFHPNVPPQPTYGLDEIRKSRGTGTYIPDMVNCFCFQTLFILYYDNSLYHPKFFWMFLTQTLTTNWNARAKGSRPRRSSHANNNNNASSKRKQIEEVPPETDMNDKNSKSFELSKEDFPVLSSIGNSSSSACHQSEQDQNYSSPQIYIEFGTYSASKSLKELSLGTKDQKKDSGVSSSKTLGTKDRKKDSGCLSSKCATTPVVPSRAVQTKEKCIRMEKKMG
jgi:hypothetical protein